MATVSQVLPDRQAAMRRQVLERFAALFESQTRTRLFSTSVAKLTRDIHAELLEGLHRSIAQVRAAQIDPEGREEIAAGLLEAVARCVRLDQTLELLIEERRRQWSRSARDLRGLMLEFDRMAKDLAGTLIEKDVLERGARVLETIVLSQEKVAQWKIFVQEVLLGFQAFFSFDIFFIAFREDDRLSLYIYYMDEYPETVKRSARDKVARGMSARLGLRDGQPFEFEEFQVARHDGRAPLDTEAMSAICVPVPDLGTTGTAGRLGLAYSFADGLTPQESSVIQSILAVMVMVVGSSKVLGRALSELEYQSTHDSLTGLHNRRYFNEVLDDEISRSQRYAREFAVLMLDLDDFKDINDTYGHPCGDKVLKRVAETMLSVMRKGDLASRIGGDEFAIILIETGVPGAMAVAEKLRTELRQITFDGGNNRYFHVTTSIGVVSYPGDAKTVSDLMAGVDLGLYRAKELGKDAVGSFASFRERLERSRANRDYAETLRGALHAGRVVPYYQTIYDCKSGAPFAYETLARIVEPGGNVLSAASFIETAEKYGLGRDLDRTIIDKALVAAKRRLENLSAPCRLFINLSAQEIHGRGILGYAEQICLRLGIPPSVIVFEILERDAISDMTHMRQFLTDLRKKGFLFALDDFGSGYNSFHYLRELSFDFVKIDGDFVKNIVNSKTDRTLVHNLTRLCGELGIQTIAEFVENEETFQALRAMGVDYAQGFHLSVPMPRIT